LTTRTAIFGRQGADEPDSDKLRELYWKRAELKKEFAEARKKQMQLEERIREQAGDNARISQKLEHLERLLVDPEWVHSVVVFYQLRGLYNLCRGKLESFAEELKQQRERRLQSKVFDAWREQQEREVVALERSIGELRMKIQMLEDSVHAQQQRVRNSNGLKRMLRRRSVNSEIEEIEARLAAAVEEEGALLAAREKLRNREPPAQQGLDLPTKRSINFMIIAFAQHLYLHFSADQMTGMAKEANDKSVGALNYGSKDDCERLLERIRQLTDNFENGANFPEVLKKRAALIAENAVFQKDEDAVPSPGTVSTVFAIDRNGVVSSRDANLLGENYWNLSGALTR